MKKLLVLAFFLTFNLVAEEHKTNTFLKTVANAILDQATNTGNEIKLEDFGCFDVADILDPFKNYELIINCETLKNEVETEYGTSLGQALKLYINLLTKS